MMRVAAWALVGLLLAGSGALANDYTPAPEALALLSAGQALALLNNPKARPILLKRADDSSPVAITGVKIGLTRMTFSDEKKGAASSSSWPMFRWM